MAGWGRRRIQRGNLVSQRLNRHLSDSGRGAAARLLEQLHLISQEPGFEGLAHLDRTTLSKLRRGIRPLYDYELIAISEALGCNPLWLAGYLDDPTPIPGTRRVLKEMPAAAKESLQK